MECQAGAGLLWVELRPQNKSTFPISGSEISPRVSPKQEGKLEGSLKHIHFFFSVVGKIWGTEIIPLGSDTSLSSSGTLGHFFKTF